MKLYDNLIEELQEFKKQKENTNKSIIQQKIRVKIKDGIDLQQRKEVFSKQINKTVMNKNFMRNAIKTKLKHSNDMLSMQFANNLFGKLQQKKDVKTEITEHVRSYIENQREVKKKFKDKFHH